MIAGYFCKHSDSNTVSVPDPVDGRCPVAHYCPEGVGAAIPCPAGTQQPTTGQASCIKCQTGNLTPAPSAKDYSARPGKQNAKLLYVYRAGSLQVRFLGEVFGSSLRPLLGAPTGTLICYEEPAQVSVRNFVRHPAQWKPCVESLSQAQHSHSRVGHTEQYTDCVLSGTGEGLSRVYFQFPVRWRRTAKAAYP